MSVLSLRFISNLFTSPNTPQTKAESYDRIRGIVDKLVHHTDLSVQDEAFLESSAQSTQGWGNYALSFLVTPSDQKTCEIIHALSQEVLNGKLTAEDALTRVSTFVESSPYLSDKESAAVANLIRTYLDNTESFGELLTHFQESHSGAEPTRDQLIDLAAKYNHFVLPAPDLAGTSVAEIEITIPFGETPRTLQVYYNDAGRLEIKDGAVAPMDISCRQHISKAQIEEMKGLYNDLASHSHYNNLALVLEFAQFVSNQRTANPDFKLEEAYEAFNPDLVELHAKHKSGTCGVLAKRFCHDLEKTMGLKGQSVGSEIQNTWMTLPIPGTAKDPIKWLDLSKELHGADHTDAVVTYTDENGNQSVIKFACSLGQDVPNEIEEFIGSAERSGLEKYYDTMRYNDSEHIPDQTVEEGTIAKTFLKGRFKAAMSKGKHVLGVDFLRGNVYINPSWAKTIEGIPLNGKKMASIDLTDLANPDEKGTYYVNGEAVVMTHREALHLLVEKAASTFEFPDDFEENLIALAQITPEFFDHLYMEPLPLIKQHYTELQFMAKKMHALSEDPSQTELYRKLQPMHYEILGHLVNPNAVALEEAIERMMHELKIVEI